MRILYIRASEIEHDPRVQKEIVSLLRMPDTTVSFFGWNRNQNGKTINYKVSIGSDFEIQTHITSIYGPWGAGKKNFLALTRFLLRLRKFVRQNIHDYDVFHVVDLPCAYAIFKILMKNKKKIIYDIFDYFADLRNYSSCVRKLFIKLDNVVMQHADCTILCTESRIAQIGSSKPKRIEIIHNSPDVVPSSETNTISNRVKFVYVGNLIEERLIFLTLEYFSSHPEVELHIGGIGPLSSQVEKYSLNSDNIFYYGSLPYEKTLELENMCNVIIALYDPVIPNHKYAAPNKFYEALALGKQLLACRGTGLDFYFENYPLGITIQPDAANYSKGVERLILRSKEWPKYSRELKQVFVSQFSWKIMENRLTNIYIELEEQIK